MNMKQPMQNGALINRMWLAAAVLLIVVGIWANEHYNYVDFSLRLIGWVVLFVVAALVVYQSASGKQFWQFVQASRNELRRVVWPTRKETLQMTGLVIVMVIVLGLIIWGIDSVLLHVIGWLTGQRG